MANAQTSTPADGTGVRGPDAPARLPDDFLAELSSLKLASAKGGCRGGRLDRPTALLGDR